MGKVKQELFQEPEFDDIAAFLDGTEIPDVDIEYIEDDGNSNCDGGGCTI